jgi:hypothetical protein
MVIFTGRSRLGIRFPQGPGRMVFVTQSAIMNSAFIVSVLLLAMSPPIQGVDLFCRCSGAQRSAAIPITTNKFTSLFQPRLIAYSRTESSPSAHKTNATEPHIDGARPDTRIAPDTNLVNPEGDPRIVVEDFHLEYSPLARSVSRGDLPEFQWLRGWRLEEERGLFYSFAKGTSRVALCYSDIFRARGNPEKGGHGPSILFQFDFGKTSNSSRKRTSLFW